MEYRVVHLHAAAPAKPAEGAACNGCGVCCAVAPCPIGMLVSRRTTGACAALVWNGEAASYRCGLIERPSAHLPPALQRLGPLLARAAARLVSAGSGCDCSLRVQS